MIDAYATLGSAFVGFLSVCLTLLWTSRARLRADQRDRRLDRESLLSGLLGELRANQRFLRSHLEPIDEVQDELKEAPNAFRPCRVMFNAFTVTKVFERATEQLGLLEEKTVEQVAFAYSTLMMFDAYVGGLGAPRGGRSKQGGVRSPASIQVNKSTLSGLQSQMKECIKQVTEAIRRIEAERDAILRTK